ncbi:hypothetical protein F3Y22_tig00110413pilonHSYRG00003 [Hibiscus syriacus]|uniref:Senescence regulator S40 n=1 Tax=Hibiscus syriacus TaxID=106335 RepID=A0A6A3AQ74_HIBSY|nr:hypothetical protein F3Y22_tig00110413pilonHSYRG00003 [Hibiscus syriacus]
MASRKMFFGSKPRYIYPTMEFNDANLNSSSDKPLNLFDFDEVDVWNNSNDPTTTNSEPKKPLPGSRASSKKVSKKMEIQINDNNKHRCPQMAAASASLPVNIPDWSKILKAEYREHGKTDEDAVFGGGGEGDDEGRVPPHEYLARTRRASFSVHEGIGRTLKGRDLRRVRNAVWKKTGFED